MSEGSFIYGPCVVTSFDESKSPVGSTAASAVGGRCYRHMEGEAVGTRAPSAQTFHPVANLGRLALRQENKNRLHEPVA
jgi:hypothetical protein